MEKQSYLSKSRYLLLFLFALIVGSGTAWGDTLTENFDGDLPTGWSVVGATHGSDRARNDSGKSIYTSSKSSPSSYYLVTEELEGSVTFYWRTYGTGSGSVNGQVIIYEYSGSVGSQIAATATMKSSTWTSATLSLGDYKGQVAIGLLYACIDDLTYTQMEAVSGPGFAVKDGSSTLTSPYAYSFGLATAGTTKVFTLSNPGTEATPIAVDVTGANGFTAAVEGNATSIPAGGQKTLTITMPDATASGSIVVTPTGAGLSAFTFNVSGTLRNPNKVCLDFAGGTMPEGWTSVQTGSYSSYSWTAATGYIGTSGTSASYTHAFTSPKLVFAKDEVVMFKSARYNDKDYWGDSYTSSLTVEYSLNGTEWTAIGSAFTDDSYGVWTQRSVTIPVDGVQYIRFNGYDICLTEIYGGQLPVEPRNLAVSKSGTSATLTWTTNGTETDWQVYTNTSSSAISGDITPINVSTTPSYEFTGLAVNTTHYAWVRSKLSDTPTYSDWKQISFYMGYTAATPSSVDGNGISNITFGTGTEVVNYNTSKNPYYQDNSAQIGGVAAGTTANVDITYATGYGYGTVIWVDWNQNYEFEESEVVYTGESAGDNPTTLHASFDISISQPIGSYRMRIAGADSYFNNFINGGAYSAAYPIVNSTYAVAHDYTLKVNEAPSVMTPTALTKNSVTATTANLGWTENGDATAWQIALGTTSEFDPDGVTPIDANANPFTLTGLTQETTYYAYVRAKKGGDTSDWSNKIDFTTPNAKPSAVVVAAGDNYAKFSWTANAGETAWQIKYSTTASFNPASEGTLQAVTTNPYTLTGLVPETTYYAYLRADLGGGNYSDWTAKQTIETGFSHELTVNAGSDTNDAVPFKGYNGDSSSQGDGQFIIPASQLAGMNGGKIKSITFYTNNAPSWSSAGTSSYTVYLKEVDNTEFTSTAFVDWASLTEVFVGEATITNKQLVIDLATPYNYTGKSLLVGFKETTVKGWATTTWLGVSTSTNCAVQNNSVVAYSQFLPKTTFNYETVTGPRLAVSTDALDYGELNQSSTAEDKQKTFTISNTGVAELTGLSVAVTGTGYSVSALPRTNITTEGANATPIELTVTLAPTTSGTYNGEVTVSAAGQPDKVINLSATYVADPLMGVFNDELATEAATTGQTINFGYVEAAPTYTCYIKNTGAGTLDVAVTDGGFTVSPASASLAAGEQQAFTITPNVANADATVTFAGTNNDGGAEIGTFSVTLQGTVMPLTTTFFEGFAYAAGEETPDATTTELPGWVINNNTANIKFYHSNIYYYASSTETANVITPKLHVTGTSDVLRVSAYTAYNYSSSKLIISYSADKVNWTVAATKTGDSDFDGKTYVTKEFEISGIPEGNYFFKIEMCDVAVDYFYGFSSTLSTLALNENSAPSLTSGVYDVTLNRSFVEGWNTICLPFAVTDIEGVFGDGVKIYGFDSKNDDNLRFTSVDETVAGTPYLIKMPAAKSDAIVMNNVSVSDAAAGTVEQSSIILHGSYAPMAAGTLTGCYGVNSENQIAPANGSTTMKGFRAYFSGSVAGARISVFDETTGITTVYGADKLFGNDNRVYNLKGQHVENAKKGIYIVNGKKVVIK